MKLDVLTLEQCQQVRRWRNECLETLRTPYPLTEEMQAAFYKNIICERNSSHRYWAVIGDEQEFIGMGGLTYINWYNRNAEISLIIDPKLWGKGYGEQAVELLLDAAFNQLDLNCVYGECYQCNEPAWCFWSKITGTYNGGGVSLRARKYWNGKFWDSFYFDILKDDYDKNRDQRN